MKTKISKSRFVIITVLAIIAFAILGMFSLLNKNPQKVYAEEAIHNSIVYVDFDCDGGNEIEGVEATFGEVFPTLEELPQKEGYEFDGFFDEDNVQIYDKNGYSDVICECEDYVLLLAHWSEVQTQSSYRIVFNIDKGSNKPSSVLAQIGSPMPALDKMPFREGYMFSGFYTKKQGQGIQYYNENLQGVRNWDIEALTTLYAYWTPNKYTLYFDDCNGTEVSDIDVYYDEIISNLGLVVPEKTGYDFKGYYVEPNGGGSCYYDQNLIPQVQWKNLNDIMVYAFWQAKEYNVIFHKQEGEGGTASIKAVYECDLPNTAIAPKWKDLKYTFEGYYSKPNGQGIKYYDSEMNGVHIMDVAGNLDLYANWIATEFNITYTVCGYVGKFENSNPTKYTFENADTIVINDIIFSTSYANAGVTFIIKWDRNSLDNDSVGNITVMGDVIANMTSDCTELHTNGNFQSIIINLPEKLDNECKIVADNGLRSMSVIGVSNVVYPLSINIESIFSIQTMLPYVCTLTLNNVRIKAPKNTTAITFADFVDAHIYAYGLVEIVGGDGISKNNKDGSNGKRGIYCGKLWISASDNLTIRGGNGGHGMGTYVITAEFESFKIETRVYGASGGAGGSAVYTMYNEVYINSGNVTIKGGDGGSGVSNGLYSGSGGRAGTAFIGEKTVCVYIDTVYKDSVICSDGSKGANGSANFIPNPFITNPSVPEPIYVPRIDLILPSLQ